MRTRTALVAAMTAAALVISPLALADPLDSDPSFGGDGTVRLRSMLNGPTALNTYGDHTYAAGGSIGAGSYDHYAWIEVRRRHGHLREDAGGELKVGADYPIARDIVRWHHRVFVIGWLTDTNWDTGRTRNLYGYVAGFHASLKRHLDWGTGTYLNKNHRELQRLREVNFGSVSGGAVDSSGRVLVTGRVGGQTAVLRLTRDGHIDTSYARGGLATVTIGSGSSPRDIAVHGSTAVVVGNATVNGRKQGFVTQITGDGYRDRTFSDDGVRLIGKPGSYVNEARPDDAGRWLIAYESGKRAGVTKIGATGDVVGTFGRHGRASIRCTQPDRRHVLDSLAIDRKGGALHRVALATSCRRHGDLRHLASIWRPGGQPITSLRPDATAQLPWGAHTIDLSYGWRGRLTGLINPMALVRTR